MLESHVPYLPLIVTLVLCAGMMGAGLVLNYVLGPKRLTKTKLEPFESGEVPLTSPRQRFSIKFYMVAIFFIVFDIEAVFLFPWAVLYKSWLADPAFAMVAFTEMFLFLGILALGLLYVWKRGALKWD